MQAVSALVGFGAFLVSAGMFPDMLGMLLKIVLAIIVGLCVYAVTLVLLSFAMDGIEAAIERFRK